MDMGLEGRYLKCIAENNWNTGENAIGTYIKITRVDNLGDFYIGKEPFYANRIKEKEWELMLEGWIPKSTSYSNNLQKNLYLW